ncbi:hypothetical protein B0H13DRAFT_1859534 [Mycena leptocephala]|nr:hypothetical protein B0H13DRAFT_1859534 [Mycena leptocephala]
MHHVRFKPLLSSRGRGRGLELRRKAEGSSSTENGEDPRTVHNTATYPFAGASREVVPQPQAFERRKLAWDSDYGTRFAILSSSRWHGARECSGKFKLEGKTQKDEGAAAPLGGDSERWVAGLRLGGFFVGVVVFARLGRWIQRNKNEEKNRILMDSMYPDFDYDYTPPSTGWPFDPHPLDDPLLAPRITIGGSLDPATGIFYRTPEHPRLRTAQACEKCRSRKAKCSGEHPSCSRCLVRGLPREYVQAGHVHGPNKQTKSSAGSSASSSSHSHSSRG